jgi:hypothetical protein
MSNRNKWAHRRVSEPPTRPWPLALTMMALGLFLAWLGLEGARQHIWWVEGYNFRLGTFGVAPTAGWFALGALFALLGLLSLFWPV